MLPSCFAGFLLLYLLGFGSCSSPISYSWQGEELNNTAIGTAADEQNEDGCKPQPVLLTPFADAGLSLPVYFPFLDHAEEIASVDPEPILLCRIHLSINAP
ncbi:MAG: hypothetical protein WD077_07955 [Bacteroidia bacterium]